MKKVIAVILMILCGFTVVGGGTLFLTSCGTSAEQSGEISDSGEIENPSDDENNTDKPDEDVNSPTDDTTDNGNDTPIEGYGCDYNFTIRTTVYYGTSAVNSSASSSLSSYGTYGGFSVYWRDENGNTAGWGSTTSNGCLRGTMSSAATWYDSSVGNGTAYNCSYFKNVDSQPANFFYYPKRYVEFYTLTPLYKGGYFYRFFGLDKNGTAGGSPKDTAGYGGGSGSGSGSYYIYGVGSSSTTYITTSKETAKSKATTDLKGTFYAVFRRESTLTYNANGGSGSPSSQYMYAGLSKTLSSTRPSRTGYTFLGWSTSSSASSASWSAGGTLPSSYTGANDTLYAVWKANVYTITLDDNGGSGGTGTIYLKYNTGWYSNSSATISISSVRIPTRTGYTFQHYRSSKLGAAQLINRNGTILGGYLTYTTSNDTFYAQWQINSYTLTINIGYQAETAPRLSFQNSSGGNLSVSGPWYYMAGTGPSGINYYYTYTTTYSASSQGIYVNPGTITSSSTGSFFRITFNGTANGKDYYFRASSQPTASSYTYLFHEGGILNSSGLIMIGAYSYSWTPNANATVNLFYKERFSVTYNSNNGSGSTPSTQYKIYGSSVTLGTNNLTRPGYTANGWNTKADGTGTHYNNGATYSTNSNLTLYAQWAINSYGIDINIMSPAGVQDGASGLIDLQYPDASYTNQSGEYVVNGTPKKINYLQSFTISNLRPTEGYYLKSVTCNTSGALVDNGNGTWTYTAIMTGASSDYADTITIQMTYLQQDSDGNYYIEDGKYPQSYAEVEWDSYCGDGTHNGVQITYDEKTKVITLNGTLTGSTGTIFDVHGIKFTNGQVYTITREYIGGSFVSSATNSSIVVDVSTSSNGNPSTRNNNDGGFSTSTNRSNLTINSASANEADGFRVWLWIANNNVVFNNYKFRVSVCYDSILNNVAKTNSGSLSYLDSNGQTQTIQCYTVSTAVADMPAGSEFALVGGRWFKVEPIRWLVTDQNVINANGVMTNKTLVSDKVLLASAVTNQTVSEGWAFTSSQMFSNMSGINSYTNAGHDVNSSVTYYRYGNAGQQDKVVTTNRTENGMRVASVDEVEQNTSDMRAYASDLVYFLLGINSNQYANYWTRTLGTNLGNGKIITAAGMDTSSWLSRVFGVRFAMTCTWS